MSGAGSVPQTPRTPRTPHRMGTFSEEEIMTDEDFVKAIEEMNPHSDDDIGELLKAMNENRIISWEEAERILNDTGNAPVKSSLPEQTRPTEPDNDTDVDECVQRLLENDPNLKEVNMNNMKRTPIPQIRRLLEALAYNEHCERLSLANMGLYDNDVAVLLPVIEMNTALRKLNLETNYLSGDFFAKLFRAALVNQTLEEVKAVNQGVTFATVAEKEIIDCIVANTGLTKISVNLRLPEGRHKVENATLRNGEYKRILRRQAAQKAKWEAEELAKNPVPQLPKEPKKEPSKPTAKTPVKEPIAKAKDAKEVAPKSTPAAKKTPLAKPQAKQGVADKAVASTAKEKKASLAEKASADKAATPTTEKVPPKKAKDSTEKAAEAPKKETTTIKAKRNTEAEGKPEEKKPTSIKVAALARKPKGDADITKEEKEANATAEPDRLQKAKATAKKVDDQKMNQDESSKTATKAPASAKKSVSVEKDAKSTKEKAENGPAAPVKDSGSEPEPTEAAEAKVKRPTTLNKSDEVKEATDTKKAATPTTKAAAAKSKVATPKKATPKASSEANGVISSGTKSAEDAKDGKKDEKDMSKTPDGEAPPKKVSPKKSTESASGKKSPTKKPSEPLKTASASNDSLPRAKPEGELSPEHIKDIAAELAALKPVRKTPATGGARSTKTSASTPAKKTSS